MQAAPASSVPVLPACALRSLERRRAQAKIADLIGDADAQADFIAFGYEIAIEEPAVLVSCQLGEGGVILAWMRPRRPAEARELEQLEKGGAQIAGTYHLNSFIPFREFHGQVFGDLALTLETIQ